MVQKKIIAVVFSLLFISVSKGQDRTTWMREAHFGLMVHYLADWRVRVDSIKMSPEKWNELVDHFNVEMLAKQVDSVGAGYLIFTIGQNSGYYVSPNSNYAKLTGISNKCARRDLISDLSAALKKYNIRLIVYLPSGAPAGDSIARAALNWTNGPFPNKEFQLKWESIIREWSVRWGDKIAGWWFDGCYWPNIMYRSENPPNFNSFANAARAGNAESVIGFNPGVVYRTLSITPFEDYTAGEIDKPELISIRRAFEGKVDGKQIHILSYLGKTWGMGEPRFTTEQVLSFSQQVIDQRGAISWDVPVLIDGTIENFFMQQLIELGKKYRR